MFTKLRAWLSRFFAKKSPIGFDKEWGSWVEPDVILTPDPDALRPPKPLTNNNCDLVHVIYSVDIMRVQKCNVADEFRMIKSALDKALDYFQKHFECKHKDCIQKTGKLLWIGATCGNQPLVQSAAVLVEFSCEVEL